MTGIYWNKQNIWHIQVLLLPSVFESSAFLAVHVGKNVKRTVLEGKKNLTNHLTANAISRRIRQEIKCCGRQSNWYIKYSGLVLRLQLHDQIPQEEKHSFTTKIKYNQFSHSVYFKVKRQRDWFNGIWQIKLILTRLTSLWLGCAG